MAQPTGLDYVNSPHLSDYERQRIHDSQDRFLKAFAKLGTILHAAAAVGISRVSVQTWLNTNSLNFRERFTAAWTEHGELVQYLALEKIERGDSKDNLLHLAYLNMALPQQWKRFEDKSAGDKAVDLLAEMRRMFREQQARPLAEGTQIEEIAMSDGERFLAMRRETSGPSQDTAPDLPEDAGTTTAHL